MKLAMYLVIWLWLWEIYFFFVSTISKPANQLPSYESDTIAQANSNYFCLPMGCTPMEFKLNQVAVNKENRGDEGPKQFTLNYSAATEASKSGFGTSKHFVQTNKDGEETDAGNTKSTLIQDFLHKPDQGECPWSSCCLISSQGYPHD